ncbi:uncharacterized protein LOC123532653 [Mercenaria mercenaria]|uniref:uncharacterized protein LOC123532653 n=1 Tax=Mercenaria mercenaria TaxID=6596 RepID=UPI00234F06F7|nr:uncharacterized protein LOC123532653 [Mercenaria mercenaria]
MKSKHMFAVFIFAGSFVLRSVVGQVPIGQCTKIDSCSCVYDEGTIVNLTALENTNGVPHFSNVSDSSHDLYSWNPCSPFSLGPNNTDCVNVSACMVRNGLPFPLYFDLGTQESAEFMVDANGTLKLIYSADKGEFRRITEISLLCVTASIFDLFVATGEQEENNNTITYKLSLTSKHACAYAPKITPSNEVQHSEQLSGGTIFIIVLFSLIGAYVVFGVAFQAIIKKESGRKLCPNHEFWFSIPSLITGGCKKVTSPLRSSDKGTKYDSI